MDMSKVMKFVEENKDEYYKELLEKEAAELEKARRKSSDDKAGEDE